MAADRPDKKEKKEKKEKRVTEEGGVKKEKKDKKEKKEKKEKLASALEEKMQQDAAAQAAKPDKMDADSSDDEDNRADLPLERTVVPFAVPVADEKGTKKVYKTIRKAAKNNTLKRGVKEVVKTLRKSPVSSPQNKTFPGIVIIAGDISPQDVISHLPVLCEDHNVPFLFVTSRAELGAAAKTKRPTSVVMIMEKDVSGGKKKAAAAKDDGEDDGEGFAEAYAALVKYAQKEYTKQAFWAKGEASLTKA